MKRIFNLSDPITKKENSILYGLFKQVNNSEGILHNLVPNLNITFDITSVLLLGLKFSFPVPPNYAKLKTYFEEGLRKIGWRCFFQDNDIPQSESKRYFNVITKDCKPQSKIHTELEAKLFTPNISKIFIAQLKENNSRQSNILLKLLEKFKTFVSNNDFVIKEADKNSGICVMRRTDYNNEILRQLDDESVYLPASWHEYVYRMNYLWQEVLANISRFPKDCNLKSMLNENHNAAKFYILPKVHKEYTDFPKGRPISSTIGTLNRPFSKILDAYLQPIMNYVPDVILDSTHFILLLENQKLDINKKYTFLTADVDALYTNLRISDCKKHCSTYFDKYRQLIKNPCIFEKYHISKLLQWSLDYSYIEFEGKYFIQHRGIQMGNCASVSIANISVYEELRPMFQNVNEIVFKCRFIDDIFLIVESTNITCMQQWSKNVFKHEYLTFTFKFSESEIDFLDLTVTKDVNNVISTKLYSKPTNKHKYLHYKSAHPKHLLNSLPYSCGLRILRSCTEPIIRDIEFFKLAQKFEQRDYPKIVIREAFQKLKLISRANVLKPKKPLLISNLSIHNPSILTKYNIRIEDMCTSVEPGSKVYIVIPYYNTIFRLSNHILNSIAKCINSQADEELKRTFESLELVVSYKKSNSLSDYVKPKQINP